MSCFTGKSPFPHGTITRTAPKFTVTFMLTGRVTSQTHSRTPPLFRYPEKKKNKTPKYPEYPSITSKIYLDRELRAPLLTPLQEAHIEILACSSDETTGRITFFYKIELMENCCNIKINSSNHQIDNKDQIFRNLNF